MRLKNSTDYPDHFLRRMIGWIRREIGLSAKSPRLAQFTNYQHRWRGTAWPGRILIRIHKADSGHEYPFTNQYRKTAPVITFADRLECLVHLTAHELKHLFQYRHGHRTSEAMTERSALTVLELFRNDRDALIAVWSEAPAEKPAMPKPSVVEQRQAKAAADLDRWQRKLKLAQSKVRKYKARVRYYEQRQAARKSDQQ